MEERVSFFLLLPPYRLQFNWRSAIVRRIWLRPKAGIMQTEASRGRVWYRYHKRGGREVAEGIEQIELLVE